VLRPFLKADTCCRMPSETEDALLNAFDGERAKLRARQRRTSSAWVDRVLAAEAQTSNERYAILISMRSDGCTLAADVRGPEPLSSPIRRSRHTSMSILVRRVQARLDLTEMQELVATAEHTLARMQAAGRVEEETLRAVTTMKRSSRRLRRRTALDVQMAKDFGFAGQPAE